MNQSSTILLAAFLGFIVYITIGGELEVYKAAIFGGTVAAKGT